MDILPRGVKQTASYRDEFICRALATCEHAMCCPGKTSVCWLQGQGRLCTGSEPCIAGIEPEGRTPKCRMHLEDRLLWGAQKPTQSIPAAGLHLIVAKEVCLIDGRLLSAGRGSRRLLLCQSTLLLLPALLVRLLLSINCRSLLLRDQGLMY